MCLALPVKIDSIDKKGNVYVRFKDEKVKVSDVMVKVKKGDYVYLHGSVIFAKVNKKEVEEVNRIVN